MTALSPNIEKMVLAGLEARTATTSFPQRRKNARHRGARFVITATAKSATPSVTPKIQGKWNAADAWADIPGATAAAITDAGTTVILVYPGSPAYDSTGLTFFAGYSPQPLPPYYQLVMTAGDSDSLTYRADVYVLP